MKPVHHPSIPAELASVKPLGDFVLVRRDLDQERSNVIIAPGWRNKGVDGVKRGTVIAVGPGDKGVFLWCETCHETRQGFPVMQGTARGDVSYSLRTKCPKCGNPRSIAMDWVRDGDPLEARAPMHVKPGDEILYHRAPANNVVIDDQEFVLLHEEQHILAVIEKEAA